MGRWKRFDHTDNPAPGPKPCAGKAWKHAWTVNYTVPKSPPPIIQMTARVFDYAANTRALEFGFPTGEWYGTVSGHGQGNVYNERVMVKFSFSEESDGSIKGMGHVTVTSEQQAFGDCVSLNVPPDPYEIAITGRHVGDEFHLQLENPRMTITQTSKCKSGGNTFSRSTSGFLGPGASDKFLAPKVPAKDGAPRSEESRWTVKSKFTATRNRGDLPGGARRRTPSAFSPNWARPPGATRSNR